MNILECLPKSLLENLVENAKGKTIAFPEKDDDRVIAASDYLNTEFGVKIFEEPFQFENLVEKACSLVSQKRGKEPKNLDLGTLKDPFFQCGALLAEGRINAVVGGCVATTAHVIRAALNTVGLANGTSVITSAFLMLLEKRTAGGEPVLLLSDGAVVPQPSEKELAEIAALASKAYEKWMFREPRVSFLSFSTQGSAQHEMVSKVSHAAARFRHMCPGVLSEGEVQFDTAIDPGVCARKFSDSKIKGTSNVLIFPDLNAANIAYKTMERIGSARALGPILLGLNKPFSDLSRGSKVEDICLSALLTLAL